MGIERPDGYSAETKAWLEWGPYNLPLARTNDCEFRLAGSCMDDLSSATATLVTSVDGVEHRRRIRITGGVAWEYEEIE